MAALPAPMTARSAEELQKALARNWRALEAQRVRLAHIEGDAPRTWQRVDDLLDERIALRGRR